MPDVEALKEPRMHFAFGRNWADARGLKVVHVTTTLSTGGAQMALCKLLEQSSRSSAGIRHGVVSLRRGGALRDRICAAGIEVEELDLARGSVPVSQVFRLAHAIRRQRPNILQGWMYHGNLAATVGKYLLRRPIPLLWGIRYCPGLPEEDKRLTRTLIRVEGRLSRLPAAIVYCSRASARWHENLGYQTAKTVYIPNGFDTVAFRPDPEAKAWLAGEIGASRRTTIVGVVARFHPQKDYRSITAAAALLSNEVGEIRFVFVGPKVDLTNDGLMAMICASGVRERVTLLGERQDVGRIMAGLDLLCLGSAWGEAFPNVIGEAMACGVPCVATDVGDSALIVGNTGIVVPPRDPQALAKGLSRMIALGREERRQLGQAGRRRIEEHFSVAEVERQHEALYRRFTYCGRK